LKLFCQNNFFGKICEKKRKNYRKKFPKNIFEKKFPKKYFLKKICRKIFFEKICKKIFC